ncbi:MAG: protein-disulfide reductase DsbD domain-containing protein [Pseudomonadota bacterium]
MFKTLSAILAMTAMSPAFAQSSGLPVDGTLLSGWREADGLHMSGLSLDLAPGWKTYWRAPGGGGIPPRFNWSGSENLESVDVRYPVPKIMVQNGLTSIGYDSDVVFPLVIKAKDRTAPVALQAEIEIGVCEEICIPMTLQLTAILPAAGAHHAGIADSLENQPAQAGAFDCEIAPIADGIRMRATTAGATFNAEIAVIETATPGVWVSPSDMTQSGQTLTAEVEMVPPNAKPFSLARSDVRLTLIGDGRAVEMRGCR